jgi:hypothetical protein
MKKIVLISCSSRKKKIKSPAEILYQSSVFKKSLQYARLLKPDKIFVLSALHHLLPLDREIEPYNVTLAYVPKTKRESNPNLKVLNSQEKMDWGKKVIDQLKCESDIKNDQIIILASREYIKPLENEISNIIKPLDGINQFYRISTLNSLINEKSSR